MLTNCFCVLLHHVGLRVIKTTKQTNQTPISYPEAVSMVLKADGLAGLFGRGLRTRIIANGFQGLTFSVIWKAYVH